MTNVDIGFKFACFSFIPFFLVKQLRTFELKQQVDLTAQTLSGYVTENSVVPVSKTQHLYALESWLDKKVNNLIISMVSYSLPCREPIRPFHLQWQWETDALSLMGNHCAGIHTVRITDKKNC